MERALLYKDWKISFPALELKPLSKVVTRINVLRPIATMINNNKIQRSFILLLDVRRWKEGGPHREGGPVHTGTPAMHSLPNHRDGIFKRTIYTTDLNVTFSISTARSVAALKVKLH